MSQRLALFLAISLGWAALVGVGLFLADVPLDSVTGLVAMAVLYMPSPFVAALIAERGLVKDRFRLPRRGLRPVLVFLLAPALAVLAFVLLFLAAILVAGDLLGVPAVGSLATTSAEIMAGAAGLLGPAAVAAAGHPPPLVVLLLASTWGALVASSGTTASSGRTCSSGWRGDCGTHR